MKRAMVPPNKALAQRAPIERTGEFDLLGLRFQRLSQLVRSARTTTPDSRVNT